MIAMEGPGYTYHDHHDNHNSDTRIWTVTLELSIILLDVSFTWLEVSFMMFIVQASLTMAIYDCNIFMAQATGLDF
jgi:hypothetical protein